MSELKEHQFCECDEIIREYRGELSNEMHPYYLKSEVDAVIADLQKTNVMLADNAVKLNRELESLKASHYAEMVDAGMRERRLKRALWLARAEKARFMAIVIDNHPYTQVLHFTSSKRDESGKPLGVARTAMEWWKMLQEVERKCRAKMEEYK